MLRRGRVITTQIEDAQSVAAADLDVLWASSFAHRSLGTRTWTASVFSWGRSASSRTRWMAPTQLRQPTSMLTVTSIFCRPRIMTRRSLVRDPERRRRFLRATVRHNDPGRWHYSSRSGRLALRHRPRRPVDRMMTTRSPVTRTLTAQRFSWAEGNITPRPP